MTADPVEIVVLQPEDWAAYRALRLEALQNAPDAFSSVYADQALLPDSFWQNRLSEAARQQGSWLLFARAAGALVGMVGAFAEEGGQSAFVVSVYVKPQARGTGVSRMLMTAILDALKQYGCTTAKLGVNGKRANALRLYQSFGFQITHTEKNQMGDGQYYDETFMEKRL
jgi:ribosomal protein S18 acetylase RimI-like enzyme